MSAATQPILEMPMSEAERIDLSREAGRSLTTREAHLFRLRKLTDTSVQLLLKERP